MRFAALAALAGLSACASIPFVGETPVRTACDEPPITLYFEPDNENLPATAGPLIRHAKDAVDRCAAQGGRLRRITVIAFPDRGDEGEAAQRAALSRAESVVAALVDAGLPPERVVALDFRRAEADPSRIMRRNAEISFDME